jgi:hypothetical protein
MIGAGRIVLACLLGATAVGIAPSPARAAGCEAILGKWIWFTGGVVSINADGTIVHDPGNDGTWECTDPKRGRVTLRWRLGGYANRLALSSDGNGLASTDPSQSFVTAKRAPGEREVGKDNPSRPAPSRPAPRAAETPRPAPAEPAPRAEAPRPAPSQPAPRAAEAPRPAPSQPPGTPPTSPAPGPSAPAREGAGPCSGNACHSVKVFTEGGCVWLRNSSPADLNVEVRLDKETVKMALEGGDLAKAGPSACARSPKTRRAAAPAKPDPAQSRHKAVYDGALRVRGGRQDLRVRLGARVHSVLGRRVPGPGSPCRGDQGLPADQHRPPRDQGRSDPAGQPRADAPHLARSDEDDGPAFLHRLLACERHRPDRGELQMSRRDQVTRPVRAGTAA